MKLSTYSYSWLDQAFLSGFLLAGAYEVAEDAPNPPASFLLGPGGQDYVGYNSYDAWLPTE